MYKTNDIETTITHCDGCGQQHILCAMLGPDGHYTLALCANCYAPLASALREELEGVNEYEPGTRPFNVFTVNRWGERKDYGKVWAVDSDTAYFLAFEIFEDLPVQVEEQVL